MELYRSAFAESDSRPKAASSVDAARPVVPWKSILVRYYRGIMRSYTYVARALYQVTMKACCCALILNLSFFRSSGTGFGLVAK